jgi:hypothetical protein
MRHVNSFPPQRFNVGRNISNNREVWVDLEVLCRHIFLQTLQILIDHPPAPVGGKIGLHCKDDRRAAGAESFAGVFRVSALVSSSPFFSLS